MATKPSSAALIPTGARATFDRLQHVLSDAAASRTPIPCRLDPEPFTADDRADRARAAALCSSCPALHACRTYARAGRERWGVWGGRDRTGTPASSARHDQVEDGAAS